MNKTILIAAIALAGVAAGLRLMREREPEAAAPAALAVPASTRTLDVKAARALFVAPDGNAKADGSREHPLDLATALSASGPANPADTIYLLGGSYVGNFTSELRGAESAPIIVRGYPGERPTLVAESTTAPALTVAGLSTWYCCFEITSRKPERSSSEMQNVAIRQGAGVVVGAAAHLKLIDLVVHDLEGGFIVPPEAADIELYGNIVYYNGWQRGDGVGEGHGILTPNQTESRFVRDNVTFANFSHGIEAYGNKLDNILMEGNVSFENGTIAKYLDRNIMVGPGSNNLVFGQNMTYYAAGPAAIGESVNVGFGGVCNQARIVGNYLTGANPLSITGCHPVELRDNTLHGRFDAAYMRRYPENAYMTPKAPPLPTMSGVKTFVRPNQYEPWRAHVIVFNWDRLPSVDVALPEGVLLASDEFEIRSAQDYYGQPVATGTYHGGSLTLPMRGLKVAAPVGTVTNEPKPTAPEFGVFVLVNQSRSRRGVAPTPSTH
jgi:hypothetical protein